jgi:ABC-type multidrug transport system fused ATPase/permease subunit
MHDDAAIERAAHLGGASEVVSRLSNGFDTYLERPVYDIYEGLPDGMTTLFGRKIDDGCWGGVENTPVDNALSGGEMQRVAVARTFMRSSSEEQRVGLLLFDEPSASLDPTAEHGTHSPRPLVHQIIDGERTCDQIYSPGFGRCEETRR